MHVILKSNVASLGELGDIVNVKNGYALNYLIPKGLAIRATKGYIKAVEIEKAQHISKIEAQRKQARELVSTLEALTFKIISKAGSEGKLFGSVTSQQISNVLNQSGYNINKKSIVIENPIKEVGKHKVIIDIYDDIQANVTLLVQAS